MRILAIGDVHGHTTALSALLDELSPSSSDEVVFLGDYVDKGPDVSGTLELLSNLSTMHDWVFLRGNHDQMMLDAYRDPSAYSVWECLSGSNPLASYGDDSTEELLKVIPNHHIDFLENGCRNFYETDSFIFVHAGIRPHVSPDDEDIERLQWTVLSSAVPHQSGKTVVCGHSAQETGHIADLGHTICIDTGITKGKYLTCIDLMDFTYTQASVDGDINRGRLADRVT